MLLLQMALCASNVLQHRMLLLSCFTGALDVGEEEQTATLHKNADAPIVHFLFTVYVDRHV
jgi:hypothetical protein